MELIVAFIGCCKRTERKKKYINKLKHLKLCIDVKGISYEKNIWLNFVTNHDFWDTLYVQHFRFLYFTWLSGIMSDPGLIV
jgi:hypothetical protein